MSQIRKGAYEWGAISKAIVRTSTTVWNWCISAHYCDTLSIWIIYRLIDLLPSNNMFQTLVSCNQFHDQEERDRACPYDNSLPTYRECCIMIKPHNGSFRSLWNRKVLTMTTKPSLASRHIGLITISRKAIDEQIVILMVFPFHWVSASPFDSLQAGLVISFAVDVNSLLQIHCNRWCWAWLQFLSLLV